MRYEDNMDDEMSKSMLAWKDVQVTPTDTDGCSCPPDLFSDRFKVPAKSSNAVATSSLHDVLDFRVWPNIRVCF